MTSKSIVRGRRHRASHFGDARAAFVTFLMRNDSYVPGALTLGYELGRMSTNADSVCLVTESVSASAARSLSAVFDHVVTVDELFIPHDRTCGRAGVPFMFTRLNALRLGPDGDLGFGYDKVVVLDADVLPLACYDDLLDLETPAGVINERKEHFVPVAEKRGTHAPTGTDRDGMVRWHWHEIYEPVCGHGEAIPSEITDRVLSDPSNMGINGALLVLEPSLSEFRAIVTDLARAETRSAVSRTYMWPDMQYLTGRWSGSWHSVDVRYSSLNGYPHPRHLYGIHYAGIKPWNVNHRSFRHYSRFEDFKLWRRRFLAMLDRVPVLAGFHRLRRLRRALGSTPSHTSDTGRYGA